MERIPSDRLLTIALPGGVAELRRCDDHFFRKAAALSMPIELTSFRLCSLTDGRGLGLPDIYAALSTLTGPSGDLYDDWKGAFSFPFKLTVRRGDREHRYLLTFMNFRSMVEPTLYRVLRPGESYSHREYHAPFDDELSTDDLIYMIDFVRGFLEGFLATSPKWTTPFVKEVQSNLILFGYNPKSGKFSEQEYRDADAYRAALKHWQKLIPEETPEQQLAELDW